MLGLTLLRVYFLNLFRALVGVSNANLPDAVAVHSEAPESAVEELAEA